MNKFLIFALFALVAGAAAHPVMNDEASQAALFESDEKEVAKLGAEKAIFGDFCIQARDEVKSFIKTSLNSGAARVFNLLVDTVTQISQAIAEAEAPVVEAGSKAVNEDAKEVKNAISNVIAALAGTGKKEILDKFNTLREQINTEKLQEVALDACQEVSKLKPALDKKLAAYKNEILKSPEGKQYADQFKSVRVENVGCVTTGRVSKITTGCRMVNLLGPSLMEMMGYN